MKKGIYKHYKGNSYLVLTTAIHSETLEKMVVYAGDIEDSKHKVWVRPEKMFKEYVKVNGKKVKRFKFVAPVGEIMLP